VERGYVILGQVSILDNAIPAMSLKGRRGEKLKDKEGKVIQLEYLINQRETK
jgi:hypothetical protein